MNSTNAKKRRRKIIVSRRLNSTSSRSFSLGNIANNKRRISALLKNNKTLAVALQDTRCELSTKQKLLENASEHFKNIMQARVQLLEMHSLLKSVMKSFDNTLVLLKVDSIKISDLTVPFQSCGEFKSKMKKLAESVEEMPEENSFSVEKEKLNNDNGMIKTVYSDISRGCNSSNVNCVSMEVTDGCVDKIRTDSGTKIDLPVQVFTENESPFNSRNTANTIGPVSSVMLCKNSDEVMNPNGEKQTSPTKTDSLKDVESTGTPKLSIPSIKPYINAETSSIFKARVSFKNPSSSVENTSNVLKPSLSSSQKIRSSKIPKFHNLSFGTKRESNLSDIISDSQQISSVKNVHISVEPCINVCRKTFVVKNTAAAAALSEPIDTVNQKEMNENNLNAIEDSGQINRRETFVIKSFDISENTTKPLSDCRKTFVKKSDNSIKTRKSVKNRRGTFVLPDTKENYTNNENVASATEILACDDIEKENLGNLHTERNVSEELQSVSDKTKEKTENSKALQDNLICSEISTKMIVPQDYSQGNETVSKIRKRTPEKKEKELKHKKGSSNDAEENPFKAENVNEKVVSSHNIESSNDCVTFVKSNSSIKARKSVKNRRGTFVLPNTKESYTNKENVASVTKNLACGDTKKENSEQFHTEINVSEELQSVSDKAKEKTENSKALQDNLICSEISIKMISLQDYSQGKETVSKTRKRAPEKKEKELNQKKISSNDAEENSFKAENVNEKAATSGNIELSNVCVTLQDCGEHLHDENDIEVLEENGRRSRSHKRVRYTMFLESSNSDCESIPDLDLQFIPEPSTKSFPIRRKISGSRKQKVFAFSAHKRKSVQSKKSLNILPKISVKHPDFFKESKNDPQFDCTSIKNKDDITSNSKYQSEKKLGKSVDCTAKMCDSGTSCSAYYEAPCNKQEISQSTSSGDKNEKNDKSVDVENLKKQGSLGTEFTVSKSDKNISKNSVSCKNSPEITSDKFVSSVEFKSENLDCTSKDSREGQDIINNVSNEAKQNGETNTSSKNSKVKKNTSKVVFHVDDIPVRKSSKRNNSKKQSKQIITVDQGEINKIDLLVKNEDQGKRKMQRNKAKVKTCKKKSPVNLLKDNTIVVEAQVHPPPRSLSKSETGILNKENKEKNVCENFQVSVVLSDIFQSTSIDTLSLPHKDKLVPDSISIPLKTPLSDNSSNILTSVGDKIESDGCTVHSVQEIKSSKRNKIVNYAEPSLRKKLRR